MDTYNRRVASYPIRLFGDPVLKNPAAEVVDIDGRFVALVDAMFDTMFDARGVGLAAPQVGVGQRFFVYDVAEDDGPHVLVNPRVVETEGEWNYEEGCLSMPGLAVEIVRPKLVTVQATDLDGNEVIVQGDELLGRCLLHEIDHLDGVLMFDRMERDVRKAALKEWHKRGAQSSPNGHALSPAGPRPTPACVSSTSDRPRPRCRRCARCTAPATTSRSW